MKKLFLLPMILFAGLFFLNGFGPKLNTCGRTFSSRPPQCRQMEDNILAATVLLELHGTIEIEDGTGYEEVKGTISHATVVEGRYLVTHNHFGVRLSQMSLFEQYGGGAFSGVSVYRVDGRLVLDNAPVTTFTVLFEDGETTVLDFGLVEGQGLFAQAGLASVEIAAEDDAKLRPGMEVAQLDWDPQGQTIVVWTRVELVELQEGQRVAKVDHYIAMGASGGGLFLDGVHVGNNWARIVGTSPETGEVVDQFSWVALNAPAMNGLVSLAELSLKGQRLN